MNSVDTKSTVSIEHAVIVHLGFHCALANYYFPRTSLTIKQKQFCRIPEQFHAALVILCLILPKREINLCSTLKQTSVLTQRLSARVLRIACCNET